VTDTGVDVRVDMIPDPENFLEKLRGAYAIRKFRATFTGPNPVDADELFQKPLSVYAQRMDASYGVLEVTGESLNELMGDPFYRSFTAGPLLLSEDSYSRVKGILLDPFSRAVLEE